MGHSYVALDINNTDPELIGYYLHGIRYIKLALTDNECPYSPQQLLTYQCMLKYSCVEIGSENDRIGIAFSSMLAKVNHSCVPNAVYSATGVDFALVAIKDLTKDEEVTWCHFHFMFSCSVFRLLSLTLEMTKQRMLTSI